MSRFHWGWRITIVYSIFALGTLGFVFFAFTQDVDLVRENYYEYSLQHDQRMEARHAASLLVGASVEQGGNIVHVHLPAEHRASAQGQVVLYRPNSTTSDQTLPLQLDASGTMTIPLKGMAVGKWTVTATWKVEDTVYEIEHPIEVQG